MRFVAGWSYNTSARGGSPSLLRAGAGTNGPRSRERPTSMIRCHRGDVRPGSLGGRQPSFELREEPDLHTEGAPFLITGGNDGQLSLSCSE